MTVYQVRVDDDPYGQSGAACSRNGANGSLGLPIPLSRKPILYHRNRNNGADTAVFTTTSGALPKTTGVHAVLADWQSDKAKLADSAGKLWKLAAHASGSETGNRTGKLPEVFRLHRLISPVTIRERIMWRTTEHRRAPVGRLRIRER